MNEEKCKNCQIECATKWVRGYCQTCYPVILKIEKLKKGEEQFYNNNNWGDVENQNMRLEHARQLEIRLKDLYEAENFLDDVSAHELEFKINSTLRSISSGGFLKRYGMDKINDYLESSSVRTNERSERNIFIYNLFSRIKVLNRFKLNLYKVFDSMDKKL